MTKKERHDLVLDSLLPLVHVLYLNRKIPDLRIIMLAFEYPIRLLLEERDNGSRLSDEARGLIRYIDALKAAIAAARPSGEVVQ